MAQLKIEAPDVVTAEWLAELEQIVELTLAEYAAAKPGSIARKELLRDRVRWQGMLASAREQYAAQPQDSADPSDVTSQLAALVAAGAWPDREVERLYAACRVRLKLEDP